MENEKKEPNLNMGKSSDQRILEKLPQVKRLKGQQDSKKTFCRILAVMLYILLY